MQQTNCHPFRHGRWLFMHNGVIDGFAKVKRDLALAVDPSLFPEHRGLDRLRVIFFLALTFGLEDDPPAAVARTIGLVEAVGREHGVEYPFQMTVATTDGERLGPSATRARASHGRSSSAPTSRRCASSTRTIARAPEARRRDAARRLRAARRPRRRLERGARVELGVVQPGEDELHPFEPVAPS